MPFEQLFEWCPKSEIGSNDGAKTGKYRLYIASATILKYYNESLAKGESLVFGTGGNPAIHYTEGEFAYTNHCEAAQKKSSNICTKFYYYYFQQERMAQLQSTFVGGGIKNSSKKKIGKLLVPLLPLEEQQRIAARLDELLSNVEATEEEMRTVEHRLKLYRQATLKHTFDELLSDSCTQMFHIDEFLCSDRRGMATGPFGTMIKKSDHRTSGVPMLGIENIGIGEFVDGSKIFVTEEKAKELSSFALKGGDIIISRSGTVGEICVVPDRMKGSLLSTNLMRISVDANKILANYFVYLFQSKGVVLDQVKELCKGSTRDFLTQKILKQIRFPLPSIAKQKDILKQIEQELTIYSEIKKTIQLGLIQLEALRQSILREAFNGNL